MGKFIREQLPEPKDYFDGVELKLAGPGKWKTTRCEFHGGSDSMRVNTGTGAWVCMSCGEKGGDVLSYHMARHGLEFIDAARALGAWDDEGRAPRPERAAPLPARAAIQALAFESTLTAVAAGNVAHGVALTDLDRARLMVAAGRINRIAEGFQ